MHTNKNEKISVYGGYGFVLGEFSQKYKDHAIRVDKASLDPPTNNILYGISTVDNYNIYDSPTLDIETNLVHFMEVLGKAHEKYGNNFHFTLISTWFVYGHTPSSVESPLQEASICAPWGFYSITARTREQLLITYCETFKIPYKILRLANVLGAKDKKVSKKKNALQYLIDKVVHDEPVGLDNNGEFYRNYIDVRDCADAIFLAMNAQTPHIVNIANEVSHKFKDLVKYAIDYSDSKSTMWEKLDAEHNPSSVFISNTTLKSIGYVPKFTVYESIEDIVDAYKG